jgi:hypothetical protein
MENVAAQWLGLPNAIDDDGENSYNETWALFYPSAQIEADYASITTEHAAETLRHLAKTGEVKWEEA